MVTVLGHHLTRHEMHGMLCQLTFNKPSREQASVTNWRLFKEYLICRSQVTFYFDFILHCMVPRSPCNGRPI